MTESTETSRRAVLGGAAAIGAGAVLAACGGGDQPEPSTSEPRTAPGTPAAKVSEVPVGSGVISTAAKAVITQPTAGHFKAFDWTCTHKGCPVKKVEGDTIICPCHGSQYSTKDGSVTKGPATRGLTPVRVVEQGGELFVQG